jgi:hypothetical protein
MSAHKPCDKAGMQASVFIGKPPIKSGELTGEKSVCLGEFQIV